MTLDRPVTDSEIQSTLTKLEGMEEIPRTFSLLPVLDWWTNAIEAYVGLIPWDKYPTAANQFAVRLQSLLDKVRGVDNVEEILSDTVYSTHTE